MSLRLTEICRFNKKSLNRFKDFRDFCLPARGHTYSACQGLQDLSDFNPIFLCLWHHLRVDFYSLKMVNLLNFLINQNTVNDSCSLNWIILKRFLGKIALNTCHAGSKLTIESGVNKTGQTNIYLLIYLFIYKIRWNISSRWLEKFQNVINRSLFSLEVLKSCNNKLEIEVHNREMKKVERILIFATLCWTTSKGKYR